MAAMGFRHKPRHMRRDRGRRRGGDEGRTERDQDAPEDADLDADTHAWWAQRDQLDQGVPRGRHFQRDAEARPDLDDQWSIDKLFEFVPDYDLDLDAQPVPAAYEDLFSNPLRSAKLLDADDPYTVLGLEVTATWEEIVEAHRRLARLHHPDRNATAMIETRNASEERMREVNIAYAELRQRRAR
jgi:hypothetical protein